MTSFIISVSASNLNSEFISAIDNFNYFNLSDDFSGNILIIHSNTEIAELNMIFEGKEKIENDRIYARAPSISCYEVVELFDTGPSRRTGIMFCIDDNGPNNSNPPSYPYHGGGGRANSSNKQIINQLTGKANCTYLKLKNNSILEKTIERFKGKTPINLIINQKSNLRLDDYNPESELVNAKTYYGNLYNIETLVSDKKSLNY